MKLHLTFILLFVCSMSLQQEPKEPTGDQKLVGTLKDKEYNTEIKKTDFVQSLKLSTDYTYYTKLCKVNTNQYETKEITPTSPKIPERFVHFNSASFPKKLALSFFFKKKEGEETKSEIKIGFWDDSTMMLNTEKIEVDWATLPQLRFDTSVTLVYDKAFGFQLFFPGESTYLLFDFIIKKGDTPIITVTSTVVTLPAVTPPAESTLIDLFTDGNFILALTKTEILKYDVAQKKFLDEDKAENPALVRIFREELEGKKYIGIFVSGTDKKIYQVGVANELSFSDIKLQSEKYENIDIIRGAFGKMLLIKTKEQGKYELSYTYINSENKKIWYTTVTTQTCGGWAYSKNSHLFFKGTQLVWNMFEVPRAILTITKIPEGFDELSLAASPLVYIGDSDWTNSNLKIAAFYEKDHKLKANIFNFPSKGVKVQCTPPNKHEIKPEDIKVGLDIQFPGQKYHYDINVVGEGYPDQKKHWGYWVLIVTVLFLLCLCSFRYIKKTERQRVLENTNSLSIDRLSYNY